MKGNVYELPFPDNTFDCIFIGEVIEHLENPYQAIKETGRILNKNGTIFLSTPNSINYQNIKRAIKGKNKTIRITKNHAEWHHYEFSYTELNSIFENAGLKIISADTMPIKIGAKIINAKLPLLKNLGYFWLIKAIKNQ